MKTFPNYLILIPAISKENSQMANEDVLLRPSHRMDSEVIFDVVRNDGEFEMNNLFHLFPYDKVHWSNWKRLAAARAEPDLLFRGEYAVRLFQIWSNWPVSLPMEHDTQRKNL